MKKSFFYILTFFLSLIFIIISTEIFFGNWFGVNKCQKAYYLNIVQDRRIIYKVDNLYGFKEKEILHTRDKYGFRKSCKNIDEINVISIGGSTTDQRYINDGKTFQDYIEKYYKKKNKKICIANAGVSGHTTFGHIESFKSWFNLIENFNPKYFILYIGLNDVGQLSVRDKFDTLAVESTLREKSAIYYVLSRLRNYIPELFKFTSAYGLKISPPNHQDYVINNLSSDIEKLKDKNVEIFTKNFNLILNEIKKYNGIPICITQPHLYINENNLGLEVGFNYDGTNFNGKDFNFVLKEFNKVMKKLCTRENSFFIEIDIKKFERDDYYDTEHLNPIGTLKLSNHLIDQFEKLKIFY